MPPSQLNTTNMSHTKTNSINTPTKMIGMSQLEKQVRDEAPRREDGMKMCRGPFNVNCTTCKEPQHILFEMVKSLEISKISYKKVSNIS